MGLILSADIAKAAPPVLHGDAPQASLLEALMLMMALDGRKARDRASGLEAKMAEEKRQRLMGLATLAIEPLGMPDGDDPS